ncbi:hypothetical protein BDD12DRAFT_902442 [Trichophaea hybrida]|nr:hypothetical protein BDD12DRAFT_902442 [Trichophaea hybrida]
MSLFSLFRSGLPYKQVNKQAIAERLQQAKMNQEIANCASIPAPTQIMKNGSFPEEVNRNTEEMDNENTDIEIQNDNNIMEPGVEEALDKEIDSSTLTSLQRIPRAEQ